MDNDKLIKVLKNAMAAYSALAQEHAELSKACRALANVQLITDLTPKQQKALDTIVTLRDKTKLTEKLTKYDDMVTQVDSLGVSLDFEWLYGRAPLPAPAAIQLRSSSPASFESTPSFLARSSVKSLPDTRPNLDILSSQYSSPPAGQVPVIIPSGLLTGYVDGILAGNVEQEGSQRSWVDFIGPAQVEINQTLLLRSLHQLKRQLRKIRP